MRLTFWPESILLELATKCVKGLNWLTGKDNFWFSYAVIAVASLSFLLIDEHSNRLLAFFVLVVPLSGLVCGLVWGMSRWENRERFQTAKSIESDICLLLMRTTFLIMFFWGLIGHLWEPGTIFNPAEHIVLGSYPIAWYFASVQRPPFSRSRAWKLVKSLLYAPRLCPVPAKA